MRVVLLILLLTFPIPSIADEGHTFWNNVDKFLGKIADGVSKQDAITGLRTIDSPFHNEEDYRKKGKETLNVILKRAEKDGVRVFEPIDPEFIRVKRIVDRLIDASH